MTVAFILLYDCEELFLPVAPAPGNGFPLGHAESFQDLKEKTPYYLFMKEFSVFDCVEEKERPFFILESTWETFLPDKNLSTSNVLSLTSSSFLYTKKSNKINFLDGKWDRMWVVLLPTYQLQLFHLSNDADKVKFRSLFEIKNKVSGLYKYNMLLLLAKRPTNDIFQSSV